MRLRRALDEFVVDGIKTTLPLFQRPGRATRHRQRRLRHPLAGEVPGGVGLARHARDADDAADAPGYRITPELLLKAYASGVFPDGRNRADDPEVFWVRAGDARHHSARRLPRAAQPGARRSAQARFEIRFDHDFEAVIDACAEAREERRRPGSTRRSVKLYGELYRRGHCHSVECWREGGLVGGLYGVTLGARLLRREHVFARAATPRRWLWCAWSSG